MDNGEEKDIREVESQETAGGQEETTVLENGRQEDQAVVETTETPEITEAPEPEMEHAMESESVEETETAQVEAEQPYMSGEEQTAPVSPAKDKKAMVRLILEGVGGLVLLILLFSLIGANSGKKDISAKYDDLKAKYKELEETNATLQNNNDSLVKENEDYKAANEELKNGAAKQLVDVRNAYDNGKWQDVIKLAGALHEKYNGSEEDKQAQEMAQASQSKIDEAKAAKEAEEAKGYETGISYDQLSRTPDDFNGKKVKFYGKVVQVIEGTGSVQIRLAVDDDYDRILLGEYSSSIVSSRVLEDDHITIYGTSKGTISYKSTMGGTITIPGVSIEKIDQ